jgi:hypothetical protein
MSGEWLKNFLDVTMIALSQENQVNKHSNHRAINLISHTGKIVARIFNKRLETKIEVFIEDQFGSQKK